MFGPLLGVRGPVTALVQGVVDVESRCNKAVTSPRTPRRIVLVESRIDKAVTSPRTPRRRPPREKESRLRSSVVQLVRVQVSLWGSTWQNALRWSGGARCRPRSRLLLLEASDAHACGAAQRRGDSISPRTTCATCESGWGFLRNASAPKALASDSTSLEPYAVSTTMRVSGLC